MKQLLLVFLLTTTLTTSLTAQETLTFAGLENSVGVEQVVCKILEKAYTQIGIKVKFKLLPSARSLDMANKGIVDGEIGRTVAIEKSCPNLIRVQVPVYQIKLSAFTKRKDISFNGWESLKPYRIGIQTGSKFIEAKTSSIESVWKSTTFEELFKMLEAGRLDLIVGIIHIDGLKIIQDLRINKILSLKGIRSIKLMEIPAYHYLHNKHKDLIPKITAALQKMEQEGLIRKIKNDYTSTLEE